MPEKRIYAVVPGGTTGPGGMCRFAEYYVREWREHARQPEIVVLDSFGQSGRSRMPFYFTAALGRVLADGARGRIALLHLHMAERLSVWRKGLLVYAGRMLGVPVVIHLHAAEFEAFAESLPAPLLRRVTALLNAADRVVVLGTPWYDYVVGSLKVDPAKVMILRNAVPGPAILPDRPPSPIRRLLFMGVLGERKGLHELLPALAELRQHSGAWHIDIAGNGDVAKYRAWAAELGLAEHVTFHGLVDEAGSRALLMRSEALVLPSRNEGLPLAILEGMAYGLAVIATPVGAITDAVVDGLTGIIVPARDQAGLAQALRRIVEDDALCRAMGDASRQRYLAEFEMSGLNSRIDALFTQLIAQRPTSRRSA